MAVLTATGITFGNGTSLTSRRGIFPISTVWSFYQANAPTGWTKVTTQDNKALRVVSGTGGGGGGSNSFTSTMSNISISGSLSFSTGTGDYSLTTPQLPSHAHGNGGEIGLNANPATFNPDGTQTGYSGGDVRRPVPSGATGQWIRTTGGIGGAGSNAGHTHPSSGSGPVNTSLGIAVQYIDIIVCSFNG